MINQSGLGFENDASQNCTVNYISYIFYDWLKKRQNISFAQLPDSSHGVNIVADLHQQCVRYIIRQTNMAYFHVSILKVSLLWFSSDLRQTYFLNQFLSLFCTPICSACIALPTRDLIQFTILPNNMSCLCLGCHIIYLA